MAKNGEQLSNVKVDAKDVDFFVERLAEILIKELDKDYEESKKSKGT